MTETTENQKSKITLGLIMSWGLGGLFLLSGIASLFKPDAAGMGVAMLCSALLLLPPARAFAYRKTGKSLSTGLRIVLVIVLFGAGASTMPRSDFSTGNFEVSQAASSGSGEKTEPKGLIVQEFSLQRDGYGTGKIVGVLKNTTGRSYKYVQIEFGLFDDEGNVVGSTMANVNNLDPDVTWKFSAPVFDGQAISAQVQNITSF